MVESCFDLSELYQTKKEWENQIDDIYGYITDETAPKVFVNYAMPYEKQFIDIEVAAYYITEVKEGAYCDASHFVNDGYSFGGYYSDPEFNDLISDDPYFKPDFNILEDGQSVYIKIDIVDYSVAAKDFSNFFNQLNESVFGQFGNQLDLEEFFNAAYEVADQASYEALLDMAEGLFVPNFAKVVREKIINQPGVDQLPPEKQEVLEKADAMIDTCETYEDIMALNEVLDAVI